MASKRQIFVGGVPIGGGAPVAVQTMTKTETANLAATMEQIHKVADAGADLVRCAVPREQGRGGAEDDRQGIADPGDRRHPLQPHPGAESDRRRRPLHPPQPRQYRRARESRRGRREGKRRGGADADRGQLRLAAQTPARAGARSAGRGAGRRGGRVHRTDGGPRLRELQDLDQVDQRAEHDRRQPPALARRSPTRCTSGSPRRERNGPAR